MFEQLVEGVRKASESSLQLQQELLRSWTRQWSAAPGGAAVPGAEWSRGAQKRWVELVVEMLHKHREAMDSTYKAAIQIVEQAALVGDARNAEDFRRTVEELWRKLFDVQKEQAESRFRDFQSLVQKSATAAQQDVRS
jgi:hypothetical protein